MDLETAIEQCINLGLKDPAAIVKQLHADHGDDWLREQAAFYADDIAAQIARDLVRRYSRELERSLRPGDPRIVAEMHTAGVWIPTSDGYPVHKRYADCTAADFRARASYYVKFASTAIQAAAWCNDVADLIDQHGRTFKDVPMELVPALPESAESYVRELAAA